MLRIRVPLLNIATAGSYSMIAASGGFTMTGTAATLKSIRQLVCASGSFSLTGSSSVLAASMPAASGGFTLTGASAAFVINRRLVGVGGSFALTGGDLGMSTNALLNADTAIFTMTGNAAGLFIARRITLDSGTFTLTGSELLSMDDLIIDQPIDYEADTSHTVTVTASKPGETDIVRTFPIYVTDVEGV